PRDREIRDDALRDDVRDDDSADDGLPDADAGEWETAPGSGARPAGGPAARDAAELVALGLRPRLVPARDPRYRELVARYLREPGFAELTRAIADGLGVVVLDVSERA